MKHPICISVLVTSLLLTGPVLAQTLKPLSEALPADVDLQPLTPRFDFQSGCHPAVGIDAQGKKNEGIEPIGGLGEGCQDTNFLSNANTIHRYTCKTENSAQYCGHIFALYFTKDQSIDNQRSGHRHDWEFATVYTRDNHITHIGHSAHGRVNTDHVENLVLQNNHALIVYDKDGEKTHAMRFAKPGESAQNPYGRFVTPPIASWFEMHGDDGFDNSTLREHFNKADFEAGNVPVSDSNFTNNLNKGKPSSYPNF